MGLHWQHGTQVDDAYQLLWEKLTVCFARSFYIDWAPFEKNCVVMNQEMVTVDVLFFYCSNGEC